MPNEWDHLFEFSVPAPSDPAPSRGSLPERDRPLAEILNQPPDALEVSANAREVLRALRLPRLVDLIKLTDAQLARRIHQATQDSKLSDEYFGEIKRALDAQALDLMPEPERDVPALLSRPVDELELSTSVLDILAKLGTETVGDLVALTRSELARSLQQAGPDDRRARRNLQDIEDELFRDGLALRPE